VLFGYARVSTADQNPDHQIDALLRAGVDRDNIHIDTASGAKSSRPKLDLVMQLLRGGDTVKVTRLDRLSRSVLHLVTLGDLFGVPRSTVYGHLDPDNTTPRQPKKAATAKP
jgi:DNA invertase Pin-like site-specific DNA recombinase